MYSLMCLCDIAITGAGQTIYELMITGTPFLAIQLIENQKYNVLGLNTLQLAPVLEKFTISNLITDSCYAKISKRSRFHC